MSAKAAIAWFGPGDRRAALSEIMKAIAFAARAVGKPVARQPHEFVALLSEPMSKWLPCGMEHALVEDGRPSSICFDIDAEAGPDPAAELAQRRVGDSRSTFALRAEGEREYRAFRHYLATHGYSKRFEAQRAIAASGLDLADLYEDIPSECRLRSSGEDHFLACPRCTWPMRAGRDTVECASPECRAGGARFHRADETLTPLGDRLPPVPIPVADRVRLLRGVWRYTLLPGLAELQLASRLEAIVGIQVELWPQRDRFDLLVRRAGREWRVDVKDWTSPIALARALLRRSADADMWIVVPEHRRRDVPVLREHCRSLPYRFASAHQFCDEVERVEGRQ